MARTRGGERKGGEGPEGLPQPARAVLLGGSDPAPPVHSRPPEPEPEPTVPDPFPTAGAHTVDDPGLAILDPDESHLPDPEPLPAANLTAAAAAAAAGAPAASATGAAAATGAGAGAGAGVGTTAWAAAGVGTTNWSETGTGTTDWAGTGTTEWVEAPAIEAPTPRPPRAADNPTPPHMDPDPAQPGARNDRRRRLVLVAGVPLALVTLLLVTLVVTAGDPSKDNPVQAGAQSPAGAEPTAWPTLPPDPSPSAPAGTSPTPGQPATSPSGVPVPPPTEAGFPVDAAPAPGNQPVAPGRPPVTQPAAATFRGVSGEGCAHGANRGYSVTGGATVAKFGAGGWTQDGCSGAMRTVEMSGGENNADTRVVWWFGTGPVTRGVCDIFVHVPRGPSAKDSAGRPTVYQVVRSGADQTGVVSAAGRSLFRVDQTAHRGAWVGVGQWPVEKGTIAVKMYDQGFDPNGERHGVSQVKVECRAS